MKYAEYSANLYADDTNYCVSRFMQIFHGILRSEHSLNIGVSFPELTNQSVGHVIRLFGSESELSRVMNDTSIVELMHRFMVIPKTMEPKPIPDNSERIRYVKINDRWNASDHVKRKVRRWERRNNSSADKSHLKGLRGQWDRKSNDQRSRRHPYFLLKKSNGVFYPIFVSKTTEPPRGERGFNSYGLGSQEGGHFVADF